MQQEPAQGGEQEPIPRLPCRLTRLALQHPELLTQRQHLGPELGIGLGADHN